MPSNPYDEIPYTTFPRPATHPDRLAAIGTFFGMTPAPVDKCRVLEIGCGNGNNLIAMAYETPNSTLVGVDLAPDTIAAGCRTIAAVGLANISLKAADILEFGEGAAQFDYILAHGVYSWVPQFVRERLMALCGELLSPQGIAFISYNAYPGRHVRLMLREMMQHHTRTIQDPVNRVREARKFLEFLQKSKMLAQSWAELMDGEINALLGHGEGGLFHDDLGEINDAFYFHEFAEHARRHGLQYLGEAEIHEMFDHNSALESLPDDVLQREQYLDFLKLRRFRQTLLCREKVRLNRTPTPDVLDQCFFSASVRHVDGGQIEGLRGIRISATHPAVLSVTTALGEVFPLPLSFEELIPYAGDAGALGQILFALVTGGFANIHGYSFPCEDTVTARPKASRLARYQALESRYVSSLCHHVVELDDVGRLLLPFLDGTRTHAEIARDFASATGAPDIEEILQNLPLGMAWFAKEGLLEG